MEKILYKWHYTPVRHHKLIHTEPEECWRGWNFIGTLIPMLWDCTKLTAEVLEAVPLVIGLQAEPCGETVSLGQPTQ